MLATQTSETSRNLPESARAPILALTVLIDRIRSMPTADREDLFELFQEWQKAADPDEQRSIQRAMEEVLAEIPAEAKPLSSLDQDESMPQGLKRRAEVVGERIRACRERAGLTQTALAEKAGLPQSHLSRLENAEHSATNMTLEKIANALGLTVGDLERCED